MVGLDLSTEMLEVAAGRVADAGLANVRFEQGDVTAWRDERPFDAVVGRLVMFHMPDPEAVLRHHVAASGPAAGWRWSTSTSAVPAASRRSTR